MHNEDIRPGMSTPAQEDEIMQRSVLTQVLVLHPAQLTILELSLRVESDLRDRDQDAVERAVRELARDGLVTCDCRRLAPSRAAVRFDELLGGVS
jgi:predicted transcriptional regulator